MQQSKPNRPIRARDSREELASRSRALNGFSDAVFPGLERGGQLRDAHRSATKQRGHALTNRESGGQIFDVGNVHTLQMGPVALERATVANGGPPRGNVAFLSATLIATVDGSPVSERLTLHVARAPLNQNTEPKGMVESFPSAFVACATCRLPRLDLAHREEVLERRLWPLPGDRRQRTRRSCTSDTSISRHRRAGESGPLPRCNG